MNKPKSRVGYLLAKFDKSGICGNPIISDDELKELVSLLLEQVNVCGDIGDSPAKLYWTGLHCNVCTAQTNKNKRTKRYANL